MYCYLFIVVVVLSVVFFGLVLVEGINSFFQVKVAVVKVYVDVFGMFYCGCKINWQGKKGVVDL